MTIELCLADEWANKGLGFGAADARPGLSLPAGRPSHAGRIGTAQTNSR